MKWTNTCIHLITIDGLNDVINKNKIVNKNIQNTFNIANKLFSIQNVIILGITVPGLDLRLLQ